MKNLLKFSASLLIIGSIACQNSKTPNAQSNSITKDSSLIANKTDAIQTHDTILTTFSPTRSDSNNVNRTSNQSPRILNIDSIAAKSNTIITKRNAELFKIKQMMQLDMETFTINPSHDTVIIGKKGVMIYIPKDAFDQYDQSSFIAAKTHITIRLKEYLDISDIVFATLTTTSNGQLLETGGMINIQAFFNDHEISLKPDKNLIVHFPKKKNTKDMNLFYAENDSKGINWVKDTASLFEKSIAFSAWSGGNVYDTSIVYGSFIGSKSSFDLFSYFIKYYPKDENMAEFLSKNYEMNAEFTIDKKGKSHVVKVYSINKNTKDTTKANPNFEKEVRDFFVNVPLLNDPYQGHSKNGIRFQSDKISKFKNNNDYNLAFEKKYFNNKTYDETELNYYIFSISKLGLINCDRYPDIKTNKIQFAVNSNSYYKTDIKLIITDFKSITSSSPSLSSDYVFSNIPKGLNIKIFIIQYRPDQTYYALKTSNTATLKESNFDFHPMTLEALKKDLEALN